VSPVIIAAHAGSCTGRVRQVASIEHDLTITRPLLRSSVHLRPGDTLLYDRGFLDGAEITFLKIERKVDVCTGLKSDMNLFQGAIVHAQACPGAWQAHPTRKRQRIQLVRDLSGLWPELGVPMNVCVVEDIHPKTGEIRHSTSISALRAIPSEPDTSR
jgi:hypothetical protein